MSLTGPSSISFRYFATEWMLKYPKGYYLASKFPSHRVFCVLWKRILHTLKSIYYFGDLSAAPIHAVHGLLDLYQRNNTSKLEQDLLLFVLFFETKDSSLKFSSSLQCQKYARGFA